jgi:hypothetical protein
MLSYKHGRAYEVRGPIDVLYTTCSVLLCVL